MFTGIVEATGKIQRISPLGGDCKLAIHSEALDFSDVKLGDSIAVNGVCLTVTALQPAAFEADASNETLARTSLGKLKVGDPVNLEKALTLSTRLGGHLVTGHVDGLATLVSRSPDGRSERLLFQVPESLSRYIAGKGSVCLDGVSLTVNEASGQQFSVNIIPHTAEKTTLHLHQPGRQVNIEVDIVSRYLERLLQAGEPGENAAHSPLTRDFLASHGFQGSSR